MEPERSLEQRLADVETLLETILVRLEEVELRSPTPRPAEQARSEAATPPPMHPPPRTHPPPAQAAQPPTAPAPPSPPSAGKLMRPGETLEDLLGGRVLAAVGGLAIVLGVVFFLVIAVDRGWIGVEARVALAFLGSTALLAVGLFL